MALFSTPENQTEVVAVFDVGNGTVSGALVEITRGAQPVILVLEKVDIMPASSSFADLFVGTTKAIESVGHKLLDAKRGAPTQTFCFLATPWYAGATRVVKIAKSTPFVFTKKIWQDLVSKEVKRFTDETLSGNPDAIIIENRNMSVRLNGYESMDPIGKEVRDVELSIFFSISSGNVLESFRHAINRSLSLAPVTFGSFLFASFVTIRDVFLDTVSHSILVDLGSRVTEIALIKNDTLTTTASFPNGITNIEDAIRKTFDVSPHEVDALIHLYLNDRLETSKSKKIAALLSHEIEKWYTLLYKSLKSFDTHSLPINIFITVDEDFGKLFQFSKQLVESQKFLNVTVIDGSTFIQYVKPQLASYRDPFIMLESLSITRLIQ